MLSSLKSRSKPGALPSSEIPGMSCEPEAEAFEEPQLACAAPRSGQRDAKVESEFVYLWQLPASALHLREAGDVASQVLPARRGRRVLFPLTRERVVAGLSLPQSCQSCGWE